MNAGDAATSLVDQVRFRPWGLAVAVLADGQAEYRFDAGNDPIDETTLFQIGSITKTMTGVALATAVVSGEMTLSQTVCEVLGLPGPVGEITLLELATQRSGLPRLPANLDLSAIDQRDPYAEFSPDDLLSGLEDTPIGPKEFAYSNLGFMILGLCLARSLDKPFGEILSERIFSPLGMRTAGCPPPEANRVQGYAGASPTRWWTTQLPGPGGVGASAVDLLAYLKGHVDPPRSSLGEAIELATTIHAAAPSPMGLGWGHQGGGWFHDGGTGGFTSFAVFHRPTGTAVALLANGASLTGLDRAAFSTITTMVRERS